VPILSMLTADGSVRYDQYGNQNIGGGDDKVTYKIGLEFRPTDAFLFRGNYATAFRALCAHRSDDTWRDRAVQFALAPVAWLWLFTALRLVRYYGIVTCMRQSWVTRQHGAEVWLEHGGEPAEVTDLRSQEAVG